MSQPHTKDPEDPSVTSAAYDHMRPKWDLVETLLGGTQAMREAGRTYLPQHEEETDYGYRERLAAATLFNMTDLTLDAWVGRPFSDPVKLNEDVPAAIRAFEDNIDLEGNSVSTTCRWWFSQGLGKALCPLLVDMPSVTQPEGRQRTLDDDRREALRPYWVPIRPENLIFAERTVVGGQERFTHVRIRETEVVREGFAEVFKERIRVLEPGTWTLYEKQEKPKRGKDEWLVIDEGETSLDFVPLVVFYSDRDDFMRGKPPLEDLAHLNVRHWQSTADQYNIITVARFPMLAVSGATDVSGSVMAIGPKQLLGTRDPNGRFYYVEHSGKAIESGRQDLLDLEEQMAAYGAEFLKRRPGTATATARALDSAESISPLQDVTIRFIDAVNTALDYTARWMGIRDGGGTVTIPVDFGPETLKSVDLRILAEARRNRDISRTGLLKEMQRRGQLSDEFSIEDNLEELESEPVFESLLTSGQGGGGPGSKVKSPVGRPENDGTGDDQPEPSDE